MTEPDTTRSRLLSRLRAYVASQPDEDINRLAVVLRETAEGIDGGVPIVQAVETLYAALDHRRHCWRRLKRAGAAVFARGRRLLLRRLRA